MTGAEGCRDLPPRECLTLLAEPGAGPCLIIDVRTGKEYVEGHLEGAEHIDFYRPDFRQALEQKDHGCRYLVYCRRGGRGHRAMELMKECGFRDVVNMEGGLERWVSEGLPVERP